MSEPIVLALNGVARRFTGDVSIAPEAVIGTEVEIGPESSVWFNATMRADVAPIRIGSGSNVRMARCLISMLAPPASPAIESRSVTARSCPAPRRVMS